MKQRRAGFALFTLMVFASSMTLLAQSKNDKKTEEAQKKEIQNIVKTVDDLAAGQPAANDLSLTWLREDVLKAQGNKEYVPFTVQIDPSKVSGGTVAFYWRVVARPAALSVTTTATTVTSGNTTTTTATSTLNPGTPKKDEKKEKDKKGDYAYEDISFVPVTATMPTSVTTTAPTTTSMRISRSFTVPGGTYDVYLVAKEPTPDKAPKNAPAPKISAIKQTITVPEFWNTELATSSVIVAQRIDPLPAPLTPAQQADRPYALGTMEIIPTFETKFTKKAELSTFMLIYNPKVDSANKPDVSVEYNFYQKLSGAPEKFFNKTNPQNLNAQTLPPNFDFAAGHQLQSGQAVPLASFPEGDYRLEIKITDKIANKSLTREITFTVTPS